MADSTLTNLAAISLPLVGTDEIYVVRPGLGVNGSLRATIADLPGTTGTVQSVAVAKAK